EQVFNEVPIVLGIVHQVHVGGIDDQQGRAIVVVEKACIGIAQRPQVVQVDVALGRIAAPANPLEQGFHRRLQKDHDVRRGGIDGQLLVDLLIQAEFVIVQGDLGEELVLFHQEVGDAQGFEHVALAQLLELPGALKEKVQLGGKGGGAAVLVEALQEGIVLRALEQ